MYPNQVTGLMNCTAKCMANAYISFRLSGLPVAGPAGAYDTRLVNVENGAGMVPTCLLCFTSLRMRESKGPRSARS